ncbi:hypothetical protein HK102_004381 [Quaeritorhiza haematococci]|nr:hypothetical protein HK102_004381 [Quaeritorhiza haematococci]
MASTSPPVLRGLACFLLCLSFLLASSTLASAEPLSIKVLVNQANEVAEDIEIVVKQVSHEVADFAENAARVGKEVVEGVASKVKDTVDGVVRPWSIFTHKSFPRHAIRVREEVKLCDPDVKQMIGYLDVDETKHFFFWFFESRSKPKSDPFILWLNGGPGCSSMTGLLMELGPCRVNPKGENTTYNPESWNSNANIVFLDQPVNAGFSYTDDDSKGVSTTVDAATDVYAFLQIFFSTYKQYAKLDFHVTGESYAGHYIPAIGKTIADNNIETQKSHAKKAKKMDGEDGGDDDLVYIHLKSLAIGNGLTDPLYQYPEYPEMACNSKYGPILDEQQCETMRSKVGTCKSLVEACYNWQVRLTCVPAAIYCNQALIGPVSQTGKNVYDVRKDCDPEGQGLCYSILNDIESYLNRPEIQEAIGVDREFKGCNLEVNKNFLFAGDWMRPYVRDLPPLLEQGVRVLIYAGDADYICNWIGNKAWTLELEWYGKEEFNTSEDMEWVSKATGKKAGEFRTFNELTFLRIYEAGHMVPYDQPEHSKEFINSWINPKA